MEKIKAGEITGQTGDYMLRATAANGQIRAFAATSRDLVEKARQAHNTSPVATAALGRLMTAGVMMGSMMKADSDLLTIRVEGDGPIGGLTVTADKNGNVKGYAFHPEVMLPPNAKGKLDVGGALGVGVLSVIQDIGLKEPYVGQTILVTGEIAEDLTYYYATSEQTPSSVALGVLMNKENTVRQAGGFIIQLLPGAEEATIAALEKTIGELEPVTTMLNKGMTPENILELILGQFGLEILDKMPIQFTCNCTKSRVEKALISIGGRELQEMIDEGILTGEGFDAETFNADTWKDGISFRQYDDYPAISTALSAGEVDGFCVDKSILAIYKTEGRSYIDAEFSPQEYGVATKKDSGFSAVCDDLITGWLADGTIDGLIKDNGLA